MSTEVNLAQYLPVEVIEKILEFLDCLEDRKAAGLTCSRWYSAYLNPHLRQQDAVKFKSDKDFKQFQLMKDPELRYFHFEFDKVDITRDSLQFWTVYGPFIKSLTLKRCYVGEKIFTEALSHCTALESISVIDCKDLFMSGIFLDTLKTHLRLRSSLSKVQHLDFSHNRYLSDAIVHTILAMCPFASTLNLTGCQISYHHGMYRKFYPTDGQPPSESVTTFPNILQAIEARGTLFQRLNFSETLLDNNSLLNLALSERLGLRTLEMRECHQISEHGIAEMCATNNLTHLTHLDIAGNERITDESLLVICSSLRFLTKLFVHGCANITDLGFEDISKLEKLEVLHCGNCHMIHGDGLVKGLASKQNNTLKEISLDQMGNLWEDYFIQIVSCLPELRHLNASGSRSAVTDVSAQAIFKHNRKLRSLDLSMCHAITDSGLTGKGVTYKEMPSEKQLRIPLGSRHELDIRLDAEIREQVKELCEQEVDQLAEESLAQLQHLHTLNLSGCVRVTDVSLEHSFLLKELRNLDLSGCQQISHAGLRFLVKSCRSIEKLNLNKCHNITDEAVEVVVDGLPRLKTLILGNDCVTGEIGRIVEKSKLMHLDVSHCSKVRPEAVSHLKQRVKTLRVLKYPEVSLTETQPDTKPPKPPPSKLWKWCSR